MILWGMYDNEFMLCLPKVTGNVSPLKIPIKHRTAPEGPKVVPTVLNFCKRLW